MLLSFQSPKIKNYVGHSIVNRFGNIKPALNFQTLCPKDFNPNFVEMWKMSSKNNYSFWKQNRRLYVCRKPIVSYNKCSITFWFCFWNFYPFVVTSQLSWDMIFFQNLNEIGYWIPYKIPRLCTFIVQLLLNYVKKILNKCDKG